MKKLLPIIAALAIAFLLFLMFGTDHDAEHSSTHHEHAAGHDDHHHDGEENKAAAEHTHDAEHSHASGNDSGNSVAEQEQLASSEVEVAKPFFPRGASSEFEVKVFQLGNEITMHDAWVRATPPGASGTAAYMHLSNSGADDHVVVAASSKDFANVSLHRTTIEEGLVGMESMDQLVVPSGGSVVLKPSGMHVMLMGAKRDIKEGESVDINLRLQNGKVFLVTLPVRSSTDY